MRRTIDDLRQMQSLPLPVKIKMTKRRIRDWYEYWDGQVYVSFSGGKDSTVLLHLARQVCPDIEAIFVNTGLEYPEIQQFVKTFDNVTIIRPKMRFDEVIKKYGYPVISKGVSRKIHDAKAGREWTFKYVNGTATKADGKKSFYTIEKYKPLINADFEVSNKCCDVMKKEPLKKITEKKPITAQMAVESRQRFEQWLQKGCNAFETKNPMSNPMSFWTEQDVLQYIKEYNIPIASVYGKIVFKENPEQIRMEEYGFARCGTEKLCTTGCARTGCIFCAFGAHLDERGGGKSRFERLKETHPKQYAYCIGGGEYVDGVWQPSKEGLGMGHVFEELNKIYGNGFIKY